MIEEYISNDKVETSGDFWRKFPKRTQTGFNMASDLTLHSIVSILSLHTS
jgi:hypothetical protein